MNTPDHYVPVGDKLITLNSAHDCLEHPDNEGWIFNIRDHDNNLLGSAKKYITVTFPVLLHYSVIPMIKSVPVVGVTTKGEVLGYDSGEPPQCTTEVYVMKDRVVANSKHFTPGGSTEQFEPVLCVERDGVLEFGFNLEILGECHIVYDPDNLHELGGKVRILTNAQVNFLPLPSALMEF